MFLLGKGTCSYMAPELYECEDGATFTDKVDIWALGVTMWSMHELQEPFEDCQEPGMMVIVGARVGGVRVVCGCGWVPLVQSLQ